MADGWMVMTAENPGSAAEPARNADDGRKDRFQAFTRSGRADPRDPALDPAYGLPPPPGRGAPAALREMWGRIFGAELCLMPFVLPATPLLDPVRIRQREQLTLSTPGHTEDSGNWAGAFATANGSKHLGTMLGTWQVPPKLTIPVGKNDADYSCSIWIGLDGQRRYFDSSLPQIGTLTQFPDGKRDDFAWVQWWERDSTANNFTRLALPVAPGNRIGAFLHVVDPTRVWFVIVNLSLLPVRQAVAFRVSAPLGGRQPVVFGGTAEWVLERPSHVSLTTKLDLPDFGQCHLEGLALQTTQIGAPLYEGDVRDMSSARMIRMLELRPDPPRTAIIAMPHRAGPTGVNVTCGGF